MAVLPALARNKRPDPVFFFAGGPGQSAIALAGPVGRLLGRFSNRRDIVLIDQRGTGRSAPLVCDGDEALQRPLARDGRPAGQPAGAAALPRGAAAAAPRRPAPVHHGAGDAGCRRGAPRAGCPRINLVGGSYGTRAALEYLRQFPQSVRRVVLDGVTPPDMVLPLSSAVDAQAALAALFDGCRADAACRQQHPRLDATWHQVRAGLPREVTVPHPLSGRRETLRLTPDALDGLLRAALYAPALAAGLPAALAAAAAGDWSPLFGLAAAPAGNSRAAALAQGMHFSVICAEDLPRLQREAAPAAGGFGHGLTAQYLQACDGWPRGTVPEAFYRVPVSASPVLLLSGAVDPVTPPRHGQRVAQALGARARHVVVPNAGHGVMALGCLRDLVYRFVDTEDDAAALALDTGCAQGVPRPPMFTPPGLGARP